MVQDVRLLIGHQERGIAGRRILYLRQRCEREPLVQPGAGDGQREQIASVVDVELNSAEPASTCRACASTAACASLKKG